MTSTQEPMDTSDCMPSVAEPLLFIQSNEAGQWQVNPEAVSLLSGIRCPVSAVAIVGKYRTGKSYLMNRLFGKNKGFELGPTVQSTTKGIWMWPRPHPQDPTRCLILLDTEGLHDVERGDTTRDMQLFVLALLLSNCLVYNATAAFDDVIVQQLQLVADLTENMRVKKGKEHESGKYFSKYFPCLFLVLRDFFLELKIDGKQVTADEYLEHGLKSRSGMSRADREYNAIRECIRGFFTRRRCFTLPKPVQDDNKLRHLETVSESEIRKDFLQACNEAVQSILSEAHPFVLDGNKINGPRYAEIAQAYVGAINSGTVPCIESTLDLLKKNECNRALSEATDLYIQQMAAEIQDKMPVDSDTLLRVHGLIHEQAVQHYRQTALLDDDGEHVKRLGEALENHFQMVKLANDERSRQKSMQVLEQCFAKLKQNLAAGTYTKQGGYGEYKKQREEATKQYKQTAGLGPLNENVLNEFLNTTKAEEEAIITADKALSKKEKQLALEQERLEREQKKRKAAEREQQELHEQVERQQKEHAAVMANVQADFEEKQRKLMQDHEKDMAEKEKEYRSMIEQGLTNQAEQYKILIDEMKQDRVRMQESNELQAKALDEYRKQQHELMDEMRKQHQLTSQQILEMQKQIANMPPPQVHVDSPCVIQ